MREPLTLHIYTWKKKSNAKIKELTKTHKDWTCIAPVTSRRKLKIVPRIFAVQDHIQNVCGHLKTAKAEPAVPVIKSRAEIWKAKLSVLGKSLLISICLHYSMSFSPAGGHSDLLSCTLRSPEELREWRVKGPSGEHLSYKVTSY